MRRVFYFGLPTGPLSRLVASRLFWRPRIKRRSQKRDRIFFIRENSLGSTVPIIERVLTRILALREPTRTRRDNQVKDHDHAFYLLCRMDVRRDSIGTARKTCGPDFNRRDWLSASKRKPKERRHGSKYLSWIKTPRSIMTVTLPGILTIFIGSKH